MVYGTQSHEVTCQRHEHRYNPRESTQFGNSPNSSWPQCMRPNYVSTGDQNDI